MKKNQELKKKPKKKRELFLPWVSILMALCFSMTNGNVFAQSPKRVTLDMTEVTLASFLTEITKQTDLEFVYTSDQVQSIGRITIKVANETVERVLDSILVPRGISWTLTNGVIRLTESRPNQESRPTPPPQREALRGTVTGSGAPLAGATVYNVTSNSGIATDDNGAFQINVQQGDKLRFSYIGFTMRDMNVTQAMLASNYRLNITLEEESGNITAAAVISDGIRERHAESYTGSASVFKREELQRVSNSNLFEGLKNLEPAFYFPVDFEMGSDPNIVPTFSMRGGTSFFGTTILDENTETFRSSYENEPNMPLFILDGFEATAEQVFDLNMNTVEDVTILKDAAAKALYGSKAANGVVIIQSIKVQADKPQIIYATNIELQMPDLSSYNLCTALEKLDLEAIEILYGRLSVNQGTAPNDRTFTYWDNYYNLRKKVLEGLDTYWLSKPVRFGYSQRHNLDIQLGKDDLRVRINGSYNNMVGVMKGSDRTVISTGIHVNYRWKNLQWENRLDYASSKSADSPYGSYKQYTLLNPYEELYDEYGIMKPTFGGITGTTRTVNPLYDVLAGTSKTYGYDQVTAKTQLTYRINADLTLRGDFSWMADNRQTSDYIPPSHTSQTSVVVEERGKITVTTEKQTRMRGNLTLNYGHTFNRVHTLIGNARFEIGETKNNSLQQVGVGLPADNLNNILLAPRYAASGTASRPGGRTYISRDLGALGLFSYSYANRYAADLTIRTNATSAFGVNNRWAPFWSVGLLWNVHRESFINNQKIEELKLKASVGTSGNQNFGSNRSLAIYEYEYAKRYYAYAPTTISATNRPVTIAGTGSTNMENPGLKWERKLEYNLGFITRLYGLYIDADIYLVQTKDAVTRLDIAPSTGYSAVSANIGELETKGFSVKANYQLYRKGGNYVTLHGSTVHEKQVVTKVSDAMKLFNDAIEARYSSSDNLSIGGESSPTTNANNLARLPAIKWYDGADPSAIWVVRSAGIDPATGMEVYIGTDGMLTFIYKGSDLQPLGSKQPKFRGNFGFSGEFYGFGASVTCTYWTGGQHYNQTLIDHIDNANIRQNFDARALSGRWRVPDQAAYFKGMGTEIPYRTDAMQYYYANATTQMFGVSRATSRFLQNRNEINISSVSIWYNMPRNLLRYVRLQNLKISAMMNDVATISTIEVERGTTYPFARKVTIALTATF